MLDISRNIREMINQVDRALVIFILGATLLTGIYAFMEYGLFGKGTVKTDALINFVLGLNGIFLNVVVSGVIFIAILIFYLYYFLVEDRKKSVKEDSGNISELFFFMFLWLTAISSITPPVNHITFLFGELGLTTYYEETAIYFSILVFISAILSFTALNLQLGVNVRGALLNGNKYRLHYYSFSIVPALVSTGLFLIQNQMPLIYTAIFFLLFLSIMLFVQRYGIIRGLATIGVIFGSEIIPNYAKAYTGPAYEILIFALVIIGFISLLVPYRSSELWKKKAITEESSSELSPGTPPPDGIKEDATTPMVPGNAHAQRTVDSRSLAEELFIRGVCPYCDSIEFYYNQDNTLTCKKCKSVLTGHETNFNSFNVMQGRRRM